MKKSIALFPVLFLLLFLILTACQSADKKTTRQFQQLMTTYAEAVDTLDLKRLELSFHNNIKNIQSLDSLLTQEAFFQDYQTQLKKIAPANLPDHMIRDYDLLSLEVTLQLERIALEKEHLASYANRPLSAEGIYFVPNGKNWYRYFLKRWLMADVTPEQIIDFGMEQIRDVQRDIQTLQRELGFRTDTLAFYEHLNDPMFTTKSTRKIQALFESRQGIVEKKLADYFTDTDIPKCNIKKGDNPAMSQVPAYYSSDQQTFFYNISDRPFNKRLVDLLYLHEAIPGHHYQIHLSKQYQDSFPAFYQHLATSVYQEGWAAYVEELGEEMGLYRTLYDKMGKHEWNLVRAVRVVLDVGLNFEGWSDEKAMIFWKENIYNQNDIADREIKRMRRWPVQVITYKYGAFQILEKRKTAELEGDFDLKKFHNKILRNNGIW